MQSSLLTSEVDENENYSLIKVKKGYAGPQLPDA